MNYWYNTSKIVVVVVLMLFSVVAFAQSNVFREGFIRTPNNKIQKGFIHFKSDSKIAYKPFLASQKSIDYKAGEIKGFGLDGYTFIVAKVKKRTFFLRELVSGTVSLYRRDLAKRNRTVFYIKNENELEALQSTDFQTTLVGKYGKPKALEQYNKEALSTIFQYNKADLIEWITAYNAISDDIGAMAMFDFMEEIPDTSFVEEDGILGFGVIPKEKRKASHQSKNALLLPNTVRNDLIVKPEKLYKETFGAVKAKKWTKVVSAIRIMEPLTAEIDAKTDQNLSSVLKRNAKEQQAIVFNKNMILLVAGGVESLLSSSLIESDAEIKKLIVRQAFVEYLEIKDLLNTIDSGLESKIMTDFKTAFANATKVNYTTKINKITASLSQFRSKMK